MITSVIYDRHITRSLEDLERQLLKSSGENPKALRRRAGILGKIAVIERTKASLDDHMEKTMPRSQDGYIGKEHFVHIARSALSALVRRKPVIAGGTYSGIVNPQATVERYPGYRFGENIDPLELGLVVADRRQVGMDGCPREVLAPDTNNYKRVDLSINKLIKVDSLVTATPAIAQANLWNFGEARLEVLQVVSDQLARLPAR